MEGKAKCVLELGALSANSLFCGKRESEPAKTREVSGVPVWERSRMVYEARLVRVEWKKRDVKGVN